MSVGDLLRAWHDGPDGCFPRASTLATGVARLGLLFRESSSPLSAFLPPYTEILLIL